MAPDRIYPDASAPPPPGSYYNVKDQRIPPPATYQRPGRRGRNPCCCCLVGFIAISIIIGILVGLAVLIFWLVVHPKAPQFTVESVNINGLTGVTGTSSNTTIVYGIKAYNPNKKMSFYYSDINVKVEESSDTIGQGTVASFSQGHRNTTYINGEIDDVIITSSTYDSIAKDLSDVPLYAEVNLKVKVKVGAIKTSNMKIKVECNTHVDLTLTTGSQLKNSSCKVHW